MRIICPVLQVDGQVKSLIKTILIDFDLFDRVLSLRHDVTRYQNRSFLLPGNKKYRRAIYENQKTFIITRIKVDSSDSA